MKWKEIKNYEDRYEVSDQGEVRSMKKNPPRTLKPFNMGAGYPAVNLYNGTKSSVRRRYVHDLVAEAFIGPKPSGLTVNHSDGNKTNNVVGNLEFMTLSDNTRHAHQTGLINNRGENHGRAKLTNHKVYLACSGVWSGQTMTEIADSCSVHVTTISSIWNGRSWTHHTSTFSQFAPPVLVSGNAQAAP